ncbi:MAG: PH domain-containing protein [Oscillospiraceae bacterium]
MKKNGICYFLTLIIIFLFGFGVIVLDNLFTKIILAAVGVLTAVLWILYFNTIKYEINDEFLTIKSGIFFKKTKIIPLKKILLKSSYSVGKTVFLTIIRTAGSFAVIFGKL